MTKEQVAQMEIGKFSTGFKELMRQASVAVGAGDWSKTFGKSEIPLARTRVNIVLQQLIKSSLGSTQSANSISNKDVQLLADALVDQAFQEKGAFSFVGMDEDALGVRLDSALKVFRDSQDTALATYNRVLRRVQDSERVLGAGRKAGLPIDSGPFGKSHWEPHFNPLQSHAEAIKRQRAGSPKATMAGLKAIPGPLLGGQQIKSSGGVFDLRDGKYVFTPYAQPG